MKKTFAIILALIMILGLCACGSTGGSVPAKPEADTPQEDPAKEVSAGMASPITEYASLDEINSIMGSRLSTPGVAGAEDVCYLIIDCDDYSIAEYQFKVNGNLFSERCAAAAGPDIDISGVWTDGGTVFEDSEGGELEFASSDEYKCARWFTVDGQYVLTLKEGNMDMDTFMGITEEFVQAANPNQLDNEGMYASMQGTYMDSYSQRATARVSSLGDTVEIVVSWANSASEYQAWTIHARFSEDGLLSYNDELLELVSYNEKGEESGREVLSENGEGWFEYTEDGKLLWTGSSDENCKNCVFEYMEELN